MPKISLIKIDRFAAWLLLILMFIFIISGYGMTKGIISYQLAKTLHLSYIAILLIIVFLTHSFLAIRFSFMRWRIWNMASKASLSFVYIFILSAFVYLGIFYGQPSPSTNIQAQTNQATETPVVQTTNSNQTSQIPSVPESSLALNSQVKQTAKATQPAQTLSATQTLPTTPPDPPAPAVSNQTRYFTVAQLAQYNGKNGQPAYVAINGIIYDLSSIFINGQHAGYSAGQDLTDVFNSQHSTNILNGFPIVGQLK